MASSRHPHPQAHPHSSAAHILHRNRKRHHPRPGAAGGGTSVEGDDEGEGGMGMSSSRDASEEDNDDTSNYSDSASSLRHSIGANQVNQSNPSGSSRGNPPSSSDPNNLPTSARDRVLVNSNPAGRKLSSSATNVPGGASTTSGGILTDKTPSSSSPPKHGAGGLLNHLSGGGGGDGSSSNSSSMMGKDRRPSNSRDPTAITLQSASAALASSSSSNSEIQSIRPIVRRNLTNSSSAGSGDELGDYIPSSLTSTSSASTNVNVVAPPSATPRMNSAGGLRLDSLPLPNTTSGGSGVMSTPRAQIQPSATATSVSKDQQLFNNSTTGGAGDDEDEDTDKEREDLGDNENDGGSETDGATYDGDVEFAARIPASTLLQSGHTPGTSNSNPTIGGGSSINPPNSSSSSSSAPKEAPSRSYLTLNKKLSKSEGEEKEMKIDPPSPAEIRKWFQSVLNGTDENGKARDYKINKPVDEGRNENRPIRIYADGVYDLFHYAHMLQLRQAKLSFPQVHLIVGVCSSSDCTSHKNTPVLNSSERYNAVKNCRWVDEVLEDAPWVIDQQLIDDLKLDYVAHDEAPYGGKGSEDIYQFVKDQGKFLPTRRTPGVSTSELLVRIVDQYRHHNFDGKLEKMGLGKLSWKDDEEEEEKEKK